MGQKTEDLDVQLQLIDSLCLMFETEKLNQADVKLIIGPAFKKIQSPEEDVRNGFLEILMLSIDKLPSTVLTDVKILLELDVNLSHFSSQTLLSQTLACGEVHCSIPSSI